MKSKSETGTTYRSIRHRGEAHVEAESATPEHSVEHSLTAAKGAINRERQTVDAQAATSFKPSPERETADRIGTHAAEAKGKGK